MQKILLITGWGVGVKPLDHLAQSLDQQGLEVETIDIFDPLNSVELDKYAQLAEHFDVLMGWSLGGQLATHLAQYLYESTGKAKTLITLASNPCFIEKPNWSVGMPDSTFQSFKQSFEKDAFTTIKRFCYLVTQGGANAKLDWEYLQSLVTHDNKQLKLTGLSLLENLSTVNILQDYQGHQLHMFAELDGLVPCKIIELFKKLPANFLKLETIAGSHGFPIFMINETTRKITQFLKASKKT